jgi:hypothetical protein
MPALGQASSSLSEEGMKAKFGIRAGAAFSFGRMTYTNSNGGEESESGSGVGVEAGVFARIPLTRNICFQPELLLVGKARSDPSSYGYGGRTYLEMPLNLLYKHRSGGGSFLIGGGPAPSIYVGENPFYYGYGFYKKFDFGLNLLAGYEIPIGFSFNVRYCHGLTNIFEEQSNQSMLITERNRCLVISLGYIF